MTYSWDLNGDGTYGDSSAISPTFTYTAAGVTNVGLRVTDSKGARQEETDWVTVTLLNEKVAEWALANVGKGDAVYAECRIADGSYKKDGETVYTTDIIANAFHKLDLGHRDEVEA